MKKLKLVLQHFSDVMNATTSNSQGNDLSPEMKTFYDKNLIRLAEPLLVHDQFGQKRDIPKGSGKTIEFRMFKQLRKILTALVEGVTPDGQALDVTAKTATVAQYGGFVKVTDVLQLTAIDPVITEATALIASQAGRSLDTVTREVLAGGTNVLYANSKKTRGALSQNDKLTVTDIRKAVRALEVQNAPKINGYYVGIIHPDSAFDLMSDSEWKDWQKYTTPEKMYANEIGEIAGVRFVKTTEGKKFTLADVDPLTGTQKYVTVSSVSNKVLTVSESITSAEATALVGRYLIVGGVENKIASATAKAGETAATITLTDTLAAQPSASDKVYAAGAGAGGIDVYATLIIGEGAYGVTNVAGGGLQTIIKPAEQAGGPLNQYSTVGWKGIKTAERLVEEYMVRIEAGSTFTD